MSGRDTVICYNLYVCRISALCSDEVSHGELDKLLMPLGQAVKDNFKTYSSFRQLRDQ